MRKVIIVRFFLLIALLFTLGTATAQNLILLCTGTEVTTREDVATSKNEQRTYFFKDTRLIDNTFSPLGAEAVRWTPTEIEIVFSLGGSDATTRIMGINRVSGKIDDFASISRLNYSAKFDGVCSPATRQF